MTCDKSTFERLLPALQHLARFPRAKRDVICQRFNLATADVDSFMRESAGSIALYDEDSLDADAKKFGVQLEIRRTPKPAFIAPKDADAPVVAQPAESIQLAVRAPVPPPQPVTQFPMKTTDTSPKIASVCSILSGDPTISESAACRKAGLNNSSWVQWKKRRFGLGPVPRAKLAAEASQGRTSAGDRFTGDEAKPRKVRAAVGAKVSAPATASAAGAAALAAPERDEAEKVINLLVAGGFVTLDKVRQAREFARAG